MFYSQRPPSAHGTERPEGRGAWGGQAQSPAGGARAPQWAAGSQAVTQERWGLLPSPAPPPASSSEDEAMKAPRRRASCSRNLAGMPTSSPVPPSPFSGRPPPRDEGGGQGGGPLGQASRPVLLPLPLCAQLGQHQLLLERQSRQWNLQGESQEQRPLSAPATAPRAPFPS